MRLKDKSALIYGANGAVGSAIATRFAKEGAKVFVTGRKPDKLEALAKSISAVGGIAFPAVVDATNEQQIEAHANKAVEAAGAIDISFNAIGIPQIGIQGIPLSELPTEKYLEPSETYIRSQFLTMRAAARRMVPRKSGVVLLHTPEPARVAAPLVGGMAPAWAAMEAMIRNFSIEFAEHALRFVTLRTTGLAETATITTVFGLHAAAIGMTRQAFQDLMESMSHHKRGTTLEELASAAVFAASDEGTSLTGVVLDLTAGKSLG
jgi:NAD(P)-dependent dehydrogenase (short-subunit alcohol dehydrogenase family)